MDGVSISPERQETLSKGFLFSWHMFKREQSVISQCFHQASTGCHAKAKTILPYYLKREEDIHSQTTWIYFIFKTSIHFFSLPHPYWKLASATLFRTRSAGLFLRVKQISKSVRTFLSPFVCAGNNSHTCLLVQNQF